MDRLIRDSRKKDADMSDGEAFISEITDFICAKADRRQKWDRRGTHEWRSGEDRRESAKRRATPVRGLGGSIDLRSIRGQGCIFEMNLPLTLTAVKSLLVKADNETYAVPLENVVETENLDHDQSGRRSPGRCQIQRFRIHCWSHPAG